MGWGDYKRWEASGTTKPVEKCPPSLPDMVVDQTSKPFRSIPWTPFSPFTVCVTRKSTAMEQNW